MGTIAQIGVGRRLAASVAVPDSAARSERSIAVIRLAVTVAVTGIYASSIGVQRSLGPSAVVVLSLALIYGAATLIALSHNPAPRFGIRVATIVVDVIFVTWWVQATGAVHSEFWTLYLIVMVGAALRFRLVETVVAAFGITALHLSMMLADAATLPQEQLILRPTVMLATAFAVGVLAYQRAEQRRERSTLEAIADSRAQELGHERAEVQRLRVADVKRSEFVAIAAHEFRTPLAAIIGVLSTLKAHGDALEREVRGELIDGASSQAERLSRLVDDLLTASRIDDGDLSLALEPVDPRDLISDAERASGTIGRVHVELLSVDPVLCDTDGIVRVVTNLLDNARKYSPEDSRIVVSVKRHGGRTRFAVRDSGDGIRPEDRQTIFERFRRVGERSAPGAGLGLYISRGIVEAHGSTFDVGDAPEGGAEFSFELERAPRRSAVVTDITAPAPAQV
jgi:signal transduction histidine kinase